MTHAKNFSKLLVKPKSSFNLADRDPGDRSGVPAAKSERLTRLAELSHEIDALQDLLYAGHQHKVLVVLQGMDTAGKDGTIRHVFGAVDPLGVRAVSFRAPAGEELEHDYLWRVHRQMPRTGELVIFNRSHYEDVVIVRVRRWIDATECARRLRQIYEFERMLAENGIRIVKFFLHLSKDAQRRRLQERLDEPDKRWKFDPSDLEARKHWQDYMAAYADAMRATSTPWAPWYVVPADSKSTRNLIISTLLRDLLNDLKMKYPKPAQDYSHLVIE